jgi:hypothetical protein
LTARETHSGTLGFNRKQRLKPYQYLYIYFYLFNFLETKRVVINSFFGLFNCYFIYFY